MERGDYSGAVRRAVSTFEVLLEQRLRDALWPSMPQSDVDAYMDETRLRFWARFLKFQEVTGRSASWTQQQIEDIRDLRHRIVHQSYRIPFRERGRAQMAVDMSRWIFNWIEDDASRATVREGRIAQRSVVRHALGSLFRYEITFDGVRVYE